MRVEIEQVESEEKWRKWNERKHRTRNEWENGNRNVRENEPI